MKKLLSTLLLMLVPVLASAETVKINGIFYSLFPENKTAEVVSDPNKYWMMENLFMERYKGDVVIPSEIEYNGVTYIVKSIGSNCFVESSGITSVTIPSTITEIKSDAFKDCVYLTKVIIEDLNKWLSIVFHGNSEPISDGDHLEQIPNYYCFSNPLSYAHHLFLNDKEITDIEIPDNITSLNGTFSGMSNLKSIKIPNSVTSIGDYAFSCCSSLTSIDIPKSVLSIGLFAFSGCSKLETFVFPENVTSIGDYVFFETPITSITSLADDAPEAKGAFIVKIDPYPRLIDDQYYLSSSLYVHPLSVEKYKNSSWAVLKPILPLPEEVFTLTYIVDGEVYKTYSIGLGIEIEKEPAPTKTGYSFSGWSEIPETMPDHDVTVTGGFTINKYKLIYKVDGEEYKTLDVEYNSALTAEPAPTKTGYSFSGWSEIPEKMPDHDVTVTGRFTINKYKLIYKVDGEEYKTLDVEYNSALTAEPAPTKTGYSFSGWSEIPETMPDHDVTVTGSFTINKYKLTYLIDGEEYKTFDVEYNSAIIPEPVPTKKGMTFSGWTGIPEKMPANDIEVVGTYSWTQKTIDDIIYQVTDTINNYCKVIGNYNASGVAAINSSVDFDYSYSVNSIASKAFSGCSNITSIKIPATITTIEERAFANIDKLNDVTCQATTLPITDRTAFENSYIEDYVTLYVPSTSLEKYKATAPWKNFKEVLGIGGGDTPPTKEKCSTPSISIVDGSVLFNCETEGVTYHYDVSSSFKKIGEGNSVELQSVFTISVYATKSGYDNSDVATKEVDISSVGGSGIAGDLNNDGITNAADVVKLTDIIMNQK